MITQRDLKFRAWDNKDKKWLLGYEYHSLGGFSMFGEVMLMGEWSNIINRFILQQHDRTPDDLIVMQYIGLNDKNGKDIYEGDILASSNKENKDGYDVWDENDHGYSVVYWDKKNSCWNGKPWCWDSAEAYDKESMLDLSFIHIAGNIFENPELLKSE